MNKRIIVGMLAAVALLLAACGTIGTNGSAPTVKIRPELKVSLYEEDEEDQPQTQPLQRITEPFTEADFEYRQNQQGGITIIAYIPRIKGIRETAAIPTQLQGINVTEIWERAFARGYYTNRSGRYRFQEMSDDGQIFENLIIPPTVTSIGKEAFIGRGIKTLTLPDSLRSIGREAFAENQLSSVKLPANITEIPDLVFGNNQLTSIDIPSRVTVIGSGAFGGNQLTELTIPANVTSIEAFAFAANNISKLTFSNSGKLKTIGTGAFSKNQLKSVVLPEGLTEIIGGSSSYYIEEIIGVSWVKGILGDNPLGYIKIPSTLKIGGSDNNYRPITTSYVPAIEWIQPVRGFIYIGNADAVKVGDNISVGLDDGFNNFYASQGKKAGIYFRRGQIWVTGTQAEFDAFIADKTK
jgi:hypothetical protein